MSRAFTIQSDDVSTYEPPKILVDLGLLPDAPIAAADYQKIIYSLRIEIEKVIALLYRDDPEGFEASIKELMRLILETTRGTYKHDELKSALSNYDPNVEELMTAPTRVTAITEATEEQPLLATAKQNSFGIKRKLNAVIQARSLSSRVLEAVITLISAFPQESVSQLHRDTFQAQEILRALSSFLAFTRAGITLTSAIKHALKYRVSENEQALSPLTLFADQIKRNAPQISRDILWGIVRFIGWRNKMLQESSAEMTLGLFTFVLCQSIAVQRYEQRFYDQCLQHHEAKVTVRNADSEALTAAMKQAKKETSHQNYIQIAIWFLYVVGALIGTLGKDCRTLRERIELALGSFLIVVACVWQIFWDKHRPNLMNLVHTVAEITAEVDSETNVDPTARTITAIAIEPPLDAKSDEKNSPKMNGSSPENSPRLFKAEEETRKRTLLPGNTAQSAHDLSSTSNQTPTT